MKTTNPIKALLATLAILFSINLTAGTFSFEEENYINDIPFNTNLIFNEVFIEAGMLDFDFVEEAYIDDIPFCTECITADCAYEKAIMVAFEMDEESYINDIPFDTECITAQCLYQKALEQNFSFSDESYIDDIPFETSEVVQFKDNTQFAMSK
jgi:hypothetical protein